MKKVIFIFGAIIMIACAKPVQTKSAMPAYQEEATVVFLSGTVEKGNTTEKKPLVIGEQIRIGEYIYTSEDSSCEIMFGNKAVIRLEESTTLSLKSILHEQNTNVQAELISGSLMTKIKKFTNNSDSEFTIFSKTTACSVRGTSFYMSSIPGEKFELKVNEGTVAVKPVSYELEDLLRSNTAADFTETSQNNISAKEYSITAGKDFSIASDSLKILEAEISTLVDNLKNKKTAEKNKDTINSSLEKLTQVEGTVIDSDKKDEKLLKPLQTLGGDFFDKDLKKINLKQVSLKIEQTQALIYRDDVVIGQGQFQAVFDAGTKIKLVIKASGFKTKEIEIVAGTNSENINVKLEVQDVVKLPFTLTVFPADATVTINDDESMKGKVKTELNEGEEYAVSIEKTGYRSSILTFVMNKSESNKIVALVPEITGVYKISSGKFVSNLAAVPNGIVTADSYGSVRLVGKNGTITWSVDTSNSPNSLNFPVLSESNVFFSGTNEWILMSASNGQIIQKKTLAGETKHLFGKRANVTGSVAVIPYRDNAEIYTLQGSLSKTVTYGFSSQTTPGYWNGNLVLTDLSGVFHIVGPDKASIKTDMQQAMGTCVAVYGDTAFYGDIAGSTAAVNLQDKSVKWKVPLSSGNPILSDPFMIPDLGLVIFYTQGTLTALRMSDGAISFAVGGVTTPPAYRNGKLYYGTYGNILKALPLVGGLVPVDVNLGHAPSTSPSFLDQKVYIGTEDGYMIAINDF